MLLGIPQEVKRFFAPIVSDASKPIQRALAPMVLALLLAPHRRRLKTIAGMVVGNRVHVGTISRRLVNPHCDAPAKPGEPVAASTLDWPEEEFGATA
jgi:hypothetical protein